MAKGNYREAWIPKNSIQRSLARLQTGSPTCQIKVKRKFVFFFSASPWISVRTFLMSSQNFTLWDHFRSIVKLLMKVRSTATLKTTSPAFFFCQRTLIRELCKVAAPIRVDWTLWDCDWGSFMYVVESTIDLGNWRKGKRVSVSGFDCPSIIKKFVESIRRVGKAGELLWLGLRKPPEFTTIVWFY